MLGEGPKGPPLFVQFSGRTKTHRIVGDAFQPRFLLGNRRISRRANSLTSKEKSFNFVFGSGQVLVGLLDFKSSDGQKCPWWVRFPCTSAKGSCHRVDPRGVWNDVI